MFHKPPKKRKQNKTTWSIDFYYFLNYCIYISPYIRLVASPFIQTLIFISWCFFTFCITLYETYNDDCLKLDKIYEASRFLYEFYRRIRGLYKIPIRPTYGGCPNKISLYTSNYTRFITNHRHILKSCFWVVIILCELKSFTNTILIDPTMWMN